MYTKFKLFRDTGDIDDEAERYELGPIVRRRGEEYIEEPTQGQYDTLVKFPDGSDIHMSCHLGPNLKQPGFQTYYCHYTYKYNGKSYHIGYDALNPDKGLYTWGGPKYSRFDPHVARVLGDYEHNNPLPRPDESLLGDPEKLRSSSRAIKRKSPVRKRKSPVRKSKLLLFGSCGTCSQGGNYFGFGKSDNMKYGFMNFGT